jgi:hypothetical protein
MRREMSKRDWGKKVGKLLVNPSSKCTMFLSLKEKIMRALSVVLLVVFDSPSYAVDTDEDKAKEVVKAFLKAVAAKDIDAVMKTVDVPFVINFGSPKARTLDKAEELKEGMAKVIRTAEPETFKALEVGKVYDMAGLAKYAKEKNMPELAEQAEKLVGKPGRMVMLKTGEKEEWGFLIRFKDGKAFVACVPK